MSIDRIGTASNTQLMLSQIQKAEFALDTTNRQVVTGKVANTYAGYRDKTALMESARSAAARTEANIDIAQQVLTRLDLQDTLLSQLSVITDEVRQALTKATANQDATALTIQVKGLFDQAAEILNAKDANGFIFGGDNNQVAPVAVTDWNALAALPSISQAFANGTVKTNVRIGDTQTIQIGMLASDVGTQLFTLLQQVAQFDAGSSGPFVGNTSAAQQTFLESSIQSSISAGQIVNQYSAENGAAYNLVQNTLPRLQASTAVYKTFVSDIEDVDMPEALSRLNQNQIQLQAAFQVTSTLNRLSLLDFLR